MIAEILFLSRQDLMALGIQVKDVIAQVEDAIRQQGLGQVNQPDKIGLHYSHDGALHAMPAHIGAQNALGIKWVGSVPTNGDRGLPQTTGIIVLNDPTTGFPNCVMDGTWITAMRTGAVSAITAKHLAPKRVDTLGLIGTGVQMRTQLLALNEVLKPQTVKVYDIRPDAVEAFVTQMRDLVDVPIEAADGHRGAVEGADVVVTATWLFPPNNPPIEKAWMKRGMLAMPIEGDTMWQPDTYLTADKYTCDRWASITDFAQHGWFPQGLPKLHAELSEIVAGKKPGRESDAETIVAMNTGMAIEDITMAKLAYDRAVQQGLGQKLPFITAADEIYQF